MTPPIVVGVHPRRHDPEPLALASLIAGLTGAQVIVPDVETVVLPGRRPATTLVERSQQLDLLVVGSRGYGPLRAVLLGSVSRALAHHSRCPLIVIPRGSERPPTTPAAGGAVRTHATIT